MTEMSRFELDDTQHLDMEAMIKSEAVSDIMPRVEDVAIEALPTVLEIAEPAVDERAIKQAQANSARIRANTYHLQISALEQAGQPVPWRLQERYNQALDNANRYQQEAYQLAHPPRQWTKKIVGRLFGRKDES